jgi:uncharacterized RDD family membrane protein YckC
MPSDLSVGARAGFWRRLFAIVVDYIIISLPFQIVVAILFAHTSGHVQMTGGLAYQRCTAASTLPARLEPPPPAGSNSAVECSFYFFGIQTARVINVGRITKEGATTSRVSQGYMLDRDGHPVAGMTVDWVAALALVAYLIAMETGAGATLGNRVTRTRVVDVRAPGIRRVPLSKVMARYLMMVAGLSPMLAVVIAANFLLYGFADAAAGSSFFILLRVAGILVFVWAIIIFIQVVRKRDPLYDKFAGTAVVRDIPGKDDARVASTFE